MKDISIYQWDSDLSLDSDSPVLFCAKGDKDGLVVASNGGKVSIPNQLTAKGKDIAAYALDGAHVKDSCWIRVTALAKPSNYVYTETEIDSVEYFKDFAVAAIKAAQDEYNGVSDAAQAALVEIQKQVKAIESAEDSRIESEEQRAAAEAKRESSYISWSEEETKRQNQEATRVATESKRESDTKAAIQNISDAINTANFKVDSSVKAANTKVDSAIDSAKSKVDALISESKAKVDTQVSLAKDATDKANAIAAKADEATSKANDATVAANNAAQKANEVEAKLTGNILKGTAKDSFIHVDDAFPSSLLELSIEGATEQYSTTGKNLFDISKFNVNESKPYGLSIVKNNDYICIKGTVNGTDGVSNPSFALGDYSNTSLSGKGYKFKVFGASSNLTAIYGLRTIDEKQIAIITNLQNGQTINWKIRLSISVDDMETYEPYTGGMPSPSPDYPQEIKVLEKPKIEIRGKNLLSVDINSDGNSSDNFAVSSLVNQLTISFYNDKDWWTGTAIGPRIFVHEFYPSTGEYSYQSLGAFELKPEIGKKSKATIPFKSKLTSKYEGVICLRGYNPKIYSSCHDFMLTYGNSDEEYSKYYCSEQALTLPVEHPYLAKLPDGTGDEIKVDKDGNVSLVANVGSYKATGNESLFFDNSNNEFYINSDDIGLISSVGYSNKFKYTFSTRNTLGFAYGNGAQIYMYVPGVTTSYEKAVEWLRQNTPIFYGKALSPKTYNLGKINLLTLPETVSNIWVDSDLNPEIGITYAKDVNLAYDKLANAIVASGAVGGDN